MNLRSGYRASKDHFPPEFPDTATTTNVLVSASDCNLLHTLRNTAQASKFEFLNYSDAVRLVENIFASCPYRTCLFVHVPRDHAVRSIVQTLRIWHRSRSAVCHIGLLVLHHVSGTPFAQRRLHLSQVPFCTNEKLYKDETMSRCEHLIE